MADPDGRKNLTPSSLNPCLCMVTDALCSEAQSVSESQAVSHKQLCGLSCSPHLPHHRCSNPQTWEEIRRVFRDWLGLMETVDKDAVMAAYKAGHSAAAEAVSLQSLASVHGDKNGTIAAKAEAIEDFRQRNLQQVEEMSDDDVSGQLSLLFAPNRTCSCFGTTITSPLSEVVL